MIESKPLPPLYRRVLAMEPSELPSRILFRQEQLKVLAKEGRSKGAKAARLREEIALVNSRVRTYEKDMKASTLEELRARQRVVREAEHKLENLKNPDKYRKQGLRLRSRLLAQRELELKNKAKAKLKTTESKAAQRPTLTTPEPLRPKGLFEGINFDLGRSSKSTEIIPVDRLAVIEYLKNVQLPHGLRIDSIRSGVSGSVKGYDMMNVSGVISSKFGDINFDVDFKNDPLWGLQESGHKVDLPFLLGFRRKEIEKHVSNMRTQLLDQLSRRINNPVWQAASVALDSTSGGLAITFKRKDNQFTN